MCLFKKNKKVKTEHKNENIKLAKLITVKNNYELGVVESILTDNKILFLVNEIGANGYLKIATGSILNSTDIMVEESQLTLAKTLIEGVF